MSVEGDVGVATDGGLAPLLRPLPGVRHHLEDALLVEAELRLQHHVRGRGGGGVLGEVEDRHAPSATTGDPHPLTGGAARGVLLDEPVPVQLAQVVAGRPARLPQRLTELARSRRASGVQLTDQAQSQGMGEALERVRADDDLLGCGGHRSRLECKGFFAKTSLQLGNACRGSGLDQARGSGCEFRNAEHTGSNPLPPSAPDA